MQALISTVTAQTPDRQAEWNSEQVHPSGLGVAVRFRVARESTEPDETPSATLRSSDERTPHSYVCFSSLLSTILGHSILQNLQVVHEEEKPVLNVLYLTL